MAFSISSEFKVSILSVSKLRFVFVCVSDVYQYLVCRVGVVDIESEDFGAVFAPSVLRQHFAVFIHALAAA